MPEFTNQLSEEPSPYLQQHAHNPVNWLPWGHEAFEKARAQDKPVLLSIGYATCHWCHVMAHESFEDKQVAELLNGHFISIKVDREERPDIDNVYMKACQLTTGSGGWPLTIIMTPEKKPFYAATYIPKQSRFGRPGMMQLLPRIAEMWNDEDERQKLLKSSEEITGAVKRTGDIPKGNVLETDMIKKAYNAFKSSFDDIYGGFNQAPKFPSPHNLLFLLRYGTQNDKSSAVDMVEKTLTEMRKGGIFDHVGFGFHRYATDQQWLVPHFEKMLYDQAMLIMAYTEAWQITGNPIFKKTVDEIITYLLRDMQDAEGGFYSAEDADSEGEEGKFYVWTEEEIRNILPQNQAELFINIFNFEPGGNFKEEASGERTGANIPHLELQIDELARERDMDTEQLTRELESARQKLFEEREKRVHPLKDDKILTDWNGLMIAALSKAARVFDRDDYLEAAEDAYAFITGHLMEDNKLLHRYRNADAAITAHADDYAFLIWGLIELYQSGFDPTYLEAAINLQEQFLAHYWDRNDGGFYFTSKHAEKILHRSKEFYDGALPSANSAALLNLLRLGRLTGKPKYENRADELHRLYANQVNQAPTGFGQFLCGLHFALSETREIVIAGEREDATAKGMLDMLAKRFLPHTVVLLKPNDESGQDKLTSLAPDIENHHPLEGKPAAYICRNFHCEQPVTTVEELEEKLAGQGN